MGKKVTHDNVPTYDKMLPARGIKGTILKSDELIQLSDSVIATSNQWGVGNSNHFINQVNGWDNDYRIVNR